MTTRACKCGYRADALQGRARHRSSDHCAYSRRPGGGLARRPKAAKECVAKPRPGRLFKPHEHGNCSIARGRGTGLRRGPRRRADRRAADRHTVAAPRHQCLRVPGPTAARCRPTSPARTSTFICRTDWSGSSRCSIRPTDPESYVVAIKRDAAKPRRLALHLRRDARRRRAEDRRAAQQLSAGRERRARRPVRRRHRHHADLVHGAAARRAEPFLEALLFVPLARRHGVSRHAGEIRPAIALICISTTRADGKFLDLAAVDRDGAAECAFLLLRPQSDAQGVRGRGRHAAAQQRSRRIFHAEGRGRGGDARRLLGRARALRRGIFHPRGQEDSRSAATRPASTSIIPASSASAANA